MLQQWSHVLATLLVCVLGQSCVAVMAERTQRVFKLDASLDRDWRVSVSEEWDVLGPFPIQAREQHFLSPSFPLNLSEPINYSATWPSSYADGGNVGWGTARADAEGVLEVSFPHIRWSSLRATEGWAALQHHTVLRTSITVYPPSELDAQTTDPPRLLVELLQGSFFTVLSSEENMMKAERGVPNWYAGNIYAMNRVPPQSIALPAAPSTTTPTTYDLFVSGDYEIRLFGDPLFNKDRSDVPILSITLSVGVERAPSTATVEAVHSHDVSCDFVDGWAFGDALGVGLRSISGWWTVKNVSLHDSLSDIQLALLNETRIGPTQTRIVPIRFKQSAPFHGPEIRFKLTLVSGSGPSAAWAHVDVTLSTKQHKQWSLTQFPEDGIKASYFYAASMPTSFIVKPPEEESVGEPRPPVLALHGAGVDILAMPFWIQALPRQQRSWVIAPTGRTAWGLDWHGPSAQDAWATVDALYHILQSRGAWLSYTIAKGTRVLVVGHSNGGQGAWYLASRYPDRVVAVIPAAAYVKSQAYVPLTQSRSAHFIDPSVRAILESSLTPDDNDLFLSNLVDTPILAIHGGGDENVPVWHTREAVSILKTLSPRANVTYREDQGQSHWYPTVFDNNEVREFMRSILESEPPVLASAKRPGSESFTLTVANPCESGSLHGWQIYQLSTPGRLAKLTVVREGTKVVVQTTNVALFAVHHEVLEGVLDLVIDGSSVPIEQNVMQEAVLYFTSKGRSWNTRSNRADQTVQLSGRMSNILLTQAPFVIVIRDRSCEHTLSSALRLAHSLDAYHKLDAEIIDETEAQQRFKIGSSEQGNFIFVADSESLILRSLLDDRKQFTLENHSLYLRGHAIPQSWATLFLQPNFHDGNALALIIFTRGDDALEKALRLFPSRTGITTPDWITVGDRADSVGAAAIEGAGVWDNRWAWSEAMSWF